MALSLLFNPAAGAAQAERAMSIIRAVRQHRKTPNASGVDAGTNNPLHFPHAWLALF